MQIKQFITITITITGVYRIYMGIQGVYRVYRIYRVYIEDITRWREDMNFIFEW